MIRTLIHPELHVLKLHDISVPMMPCLLQLDKFGVRGVRLVWGATHLQSGHFVATGVFVHASIFNHSK